MPSPQHLHLLPPLIASLIATCCSCLSSSTIINTLLFLLILDLLSSSSSTTTFSPPFFIHLLPFSPMPSLLFLPSSIASLPPLLLCHRLSSPSSMSPHSLLSFYIPASPTTSLLSCIIASPPPHSLDRHLLIFQFSAKFLALF